MTGRKYQGKLALFGERVLARLPGNGGDDRFRPAVWLGKTLERLKGPINREIQRPYNSIFGKVVWVVTGGQVAF